MLLPQSYSLEETHRCYHCNPQFQWLQMWHVDTTFHCVFHLQIHWLSFIAASTSDPKKMSVAMVMVPSRGPPPKPKESPTDLPTKVSLILGSILIRLPLRNHKLILRNGRYPPSYFETFYRFCKTISFCETVYSGAHKNCWLHLK